MTDLAAKCCSLNGGYFSTVLLHEKRKELARLVRLTAKRVREGADYRWTNQGRCNCGHLAQTLTGLDGGQIHRIALYSEGEWVDHVEEFCEVSNKPVSKLIQEMLSFGLGIDELHALERLNLDIVVRHLPKGRRSLNFRLREDLLIYLETWADVIEAEISWYQNPEAQIFINKKLFVMHQTRVEVPEPLDENPASGCEIAAFKTDFHKRRFPIKGYQRKKSYRSRLGFRKGIYFAGKT